MKRRARFVELGAWYERFFIDRQTGRRWARDDGMPAVLRGFYLPKP